ncbi:MAG: helix-hairpin-helix domain-containing protein [Thiotrichaceae bacterium]|nr:helix-hairpin-helix domain-containing protein [Thiotrichaceae bacterium]
MKQFILAIVMVFFLIAPALAKVNINTADAKALETLTGIGSTKAAAIVTYRTENGKFISVEDLSKVKGIGQKTVDKLKADAEVSGGNKTKDTPITKSKKL